MEKGTKVIVKIIFLNYREYSRTSTLRPTEAKYSSSNTFEEDTTIEERNL